MKVNYVYKLVNENGGRLFSLMHNRFNSFKSLEYFEGKQVWPYFGKIFAFENLRSARNYADIFGNKWAKIYKAIAMGELGKIDIIPFANIYGHEAFWKNMEYFLWERQFDTQEAPEGTVLCDNLMLVEKVN